MTTGIAFILIFYLHFLKRILYLCGITSFGVYFKAQGGSSCKKQPAYPPRLFWHSLCRIALYSIAGITHTGNASSKSGDTMPHASAYLPMSIFLALCALFCLLLKAGTKHSRH